MRLKHFRLHYPEPTDPGSGPAAPAAPAAVAEPPATPLANSQEPPAPAEPAAPAAAAAPAGKSAEAVDNASKIDALLDTIGKEPAPAPAAKVPGGEAKPAEDGTKLSTGAPQPAKPDAPSDPKAIDLTPPEGMKEQAKARWTELAERAKQVPELERKATESQAQLEGVRNLVRESGLDQEEFGNMLEMGRLFKSANPKELQSALQQLDGLRADLATRLGVDAPGVDPLAAHADLKADVENMAISRERALEIVKLRTEAARAAGANKVQQEQGEFVKTVKAAAVEMDTALAGLNATPGHVQKVEFIRGYFGDAAKLNEFVNTYQPNQWKSVILTMYHAYSPPGPAPVVPTVPQPLRPGNVASGPRVPNGRPVTASDAVANAWDAAGL